MRTLRPAAESAWRIAWSPDGTKLATASWDDAARIVDAATGKELAQVTHAGVVWRIAWSPDGTKLATGSHDNTARIVDAATGRELARVTHEDLVNAVAWSPASAAVGPAILTGSEDGTARLWRVFLDPQDLVTAAKARAARCLTQAERAQYFLPPGPPTWCIERRLWPYHGDEWQAWLPKQRAWLTAGRQGEQPALPEAE